MMVYTPIQQIDKEIKRRKDLSVRMVCKISGVAEDTYYKALKGDTKQSTLIKLQEAINKKLVLIDNDL